MSWKKLNAVGAIKIRYSALTLLEMLISLALGTIILFSVASFYSEQYLAQLKIQRQINLQKEAHQIVTYLQQHIEHIHFQADNRENSNFFLFLNQGKSYQLTASNCLIFFYDLNKDGCLGSGKRKCFNGEVNNTQEINKEIFGFKLSNQEILVYEESLAKCIKPQCEAILTDCKRGKWIKMTNKASYLVTQFQFSWQKADHIIKLELTLTDNADQSIYYQTTAYIYLLNAGG